MVLSLVEIFNMNVFGGHDDCNTNFWPDRFSHFDVYLIETNRQTSNTKLLGLFAPTFLIIIFTLSLCSSSLYF